MLTSLPLFGEAHVASPDGEDKKRIEALQASLSKSKYSTNKPTYLLRVKYFYEGEEANNAYQVDAFLAYLLSYFVFPGSPEDGLHSFAFSMAVLLALYKRLALTPWFLGALYARLDECSKKS